MLVQAVIKKRLYMVWKGVEGVVTRKRRRKCYYKIWKPKYMTIIANVDRTPAPAMIRILIS